MFPSLGGCPSREVLAFALILRMASLLWAAAASGHAFGPGSRP